MKDTHYTVCKYSGVVVHASDILGRFISQPEIVQHPIFEHKLDHVLRIAAHKELTPIERRLICAALLKNLRLIDFDCSILPDDFTTSNIINPLLNIVNKLGILEDKELSRYPRYRITDETRTLVYLDSYVKELEHCYLWQTQGKVMPTVASQRMEATFQSQLDDAAKRFNTKTVNAAILSWGFSFISDYDVAPRITALMDILSANSQKSWKALYQILNSKTRNLITHTNLSELREWMYDVIPDTLQDRPRRIVLIRYIDALIEGQQRDLMNHMADLGETTLSQSVIKTVSGVSYLVKEAVKETQHASARPIRSDYASVTDFAKALAAYSKGV